MAVNIHITIIELNALHTKRQNLFQELDAVIHLLMEAKHWGLRKSRNATSLNSRFKSLDTLKVKIISVTFRRVIRTNHKKASKIWRHENIQLGDNGDMYVDGHKAASDVRDEFVSVTEKLMDELAQCYNVLPQLDINNTIDHRPEGDEKWFLENEKTVTQFCRKLAAERPLKDIRDEYNYPKKKGIK